MHIYFDVDGCLANFVKGISIKIFEEVKNPDTSSKTIMRNIKKFVANFGTEYRLLTEQELRLPYVRSLLYKLCARKGYFYDLELLDNGVWNIGREFCGENYSFLTAPIGDYAEADKQAWCRDVRGSDNECIVVDKTLKPDYANSKSILIDDYETTCVKFREAGGHAFHWAEGREEELREFLKGLYEC